MELLGYSPRGARGLGGTATITHQPTPQATVAGP